MLLKWLTGAYRVDAYAFINQLATRILVNEMGFMDSLYSPLCSYFGILHN